MIVHRLRFGRENWIYAAGEIHLPDPSFLCFHCYLLQRAHAVPGQCFAQPEPCVMLKAALFFIVLADVVLLLLLSAL
jgi:hypothetical protein